jgi:hypothetical protein
MKARVKLQSRDLKKSGHNKFSGYHYFELGDFLPHIQSIFYDLGLCGVVTFGRDYAELSIVDTEDGSLLNITSPMAAAELKGAHPIQQLGAVQTYQRRYLWMTALEIVEHDAIDAGDSKPEVRPEPKPEPKSDKPAFGSLHIPPKVSNWAQAVVDATGVALDLCKTPDDVMSVFKVNRQTYDKLKAEDADTYENVMALFKTMKESFK